jgi:1-aminocyclopropane-1-carboxylate deaminase/D-cysteine desulfhydrase-like pyridoxal-dependent ACC family enzyme
MNLTEITPIEKHGEFYIKRDDLFSVAGVCGGKARTCYALAQGAKGLITAGSRYSPQIVLVSAIAKYLKIPCKVHVPKGTFTNELKQALQNRAIIFYHKPGYNSVIIKRAKDDAKENPEFTYIPFGMECWEAVKQNKQQVVNIPSDVNRIIVPVGSAMTLAGILTGLQEQKLNIPVIGVVVGAEPEKRLDIYAPKNWRDMVTLVKSPYQYHESPKNINLKNIVLDPIYEAKCTPYLQPNNLFWIVGIRNL